MNAQIESTFMPFAMQLKMIGRRGWSDIARSLELTMNVMKNCADCGFTNGKTWKE